MGVSYERGNPVGSYGRAFSDELGNPVGALGERIFIELMTSDRKLKASREGSK